MSLNRFIERTSRGPLRAVSCEGCIVGWSAGEPIMGHTRHVRGKDHRTVCRYRDRADPRRLLPLLRTRKAQQPAHASSRRVNPYAHHSHAT